MKTVFFFLALIACTFAQDAYICEVVLPNFGTAEPTISLESTPYTFDNFNAVSFGSFFARSGDVEGRTCIKNNLNLPNGQYSFGYELRTGGVSALDRHLPFSLVVGGDAVYQGGAVLPDGSDYPYIGQKEKMFIGGSFTGPQYLRDLIGGSGSNFDAAMDSAQAYFRSLSTAFSNVANSGSISIEYGTATVTCSGNYNSLTVSPADFSSITSYNLVGCSADSQIVFNIIGDGQVKFGGSNIEHKKERVLYNIPNGNQVRIEVGVFGSILAPNSVYNQPGMGVVMGLVIVADMQEVLQINRVNCVRPAPPPHPPANYELCPEFEQECAGLDINNVGPTAASFRDYHVISFGDYNADTGDIEGRCAVKRHFTVGAGYTIGFELSTQGNIPDRAIDYSLLVGGNVNWTSGSIHPDTESMYVGGSFRGADYLSSRVHQGSSLDTLFDGAKTCYEGYQNDLAAQSVNVDKRVEFSAMILTCRDSSASQYVVNIDGSEMSSYTYYVLDNCNAGSQWIINVVGSGDVTFTGDSFPAALAVFNVIGSGRTIYVTGIALNGHLLAPNNNLKQTGGVIIGKVVVGNVDFALQINKFSCPDDNTPIEITTVVAEDAEVGKQEIETVSITFIPGDRITVGGAQYTVASSYGRSVNLQTPLKSDVNKGSKAKTTSAKTAGRTNTSPSQTSSSSIVSVAFALLAIVALFI